MHAQSLQSCLTLCSPMDCSPPGSSVHGILQARILEGVPSREPFPPPGALPNPGTEPTSLSSPALQADSSPMSHLGSPNSRHLSPTKKEKKVHLGNIDKAASALNHDEYWRVKGPLFKELSVA